MLQLVASNVGLMLEGNFKIDLTVKYCIDEPEKLQRTVFGLFPTHFKLLPGVAVPMHFTDSVRVAVPIYFRPKLNTGSFKLTFTLNSVD